MQIECKDAEGFDDQLSNDRLYKAKEFKNNSVLIENDKGDTRWYGNYRFSIKE
jgi:hypothetical protein